MSKFERIIPGTINIEDSKVLYISDSGNDDFNDSLFNKVTSQFDEQPIAQSGGVVNENCKLWLPTNELFNCLSYKGDVEGWRKEITGGAKILGLITGKIVCDKIELSDNRTYLLSDCKIEFY
ncbi:hypothetical protein H0I23_00920 [Cellulophaga sp. HaHaR_3_176]|uniref:hypothetical protein n=1 Tax=Cellulophaga sp. HaHaR_3_176 TaxID=1942464 RepID=UPI001C1F3B98|nr:hypothetical protein [Cellulophaga sp. HaHaR_3_176]QWX84245.1 hypothetical protein H0I23_00920 [Cellulophaga sp. HaHaR_3_176]